MRGARGSPTKELTAVEGSEGEVQEMSDVVGCGKDGAIYIQVILHPTPAESTRPEVVADPTVDVGLSGLDLAAVGNGHFEAVCWADVEFISSVVVKP